MKTKLSAYKNAVYAAVPAAAGALLSLLEPEARVFALFFGLVAIAEAVHQTKVLWRRYQWERGMQEIDRVFDRNHIG